MGVRSQGGSGNGPFAARRDHYSRCQPCEDPADEGDVRDGEGSEDDTDSDVDGEVLEGHSPRSSSERASGVGDEGSEAAFIPWQPQGCRP